MTTIAISEKAKAAIREEREGKESYEETINRLIEEVKILRGDYGQDVQQQLSLLYLFFESIGINKTKLVKNANTFLKNYHTRKLKSLEENALSERLKIKMNAIQNVIISLIVSITVLIVIFYRIV